MAEPGKCHYCDKTVEFDSRTWIVKSHIFCSERCAWKWQYKEAAEQDPRHQRNEPQEDS